MLKQLTDKAIAHFWLLFAAAGWTAPDFLWAIDHWPDGRQHHRDAAGVRWPAGWLRWRLGHWLADGRPVLSRSQRAAVRRAADRLADQAADARTAALNAPAGPVTSGRAQIDQLRAERGWTKARRQL